MTQRLTESVERVRNNRVKRNYILILFFIAVGGVSIGLMTRRIDETMRRELLQQTQLISRLINLNDFRALTGSVSDLNSPEYLRLKNQFSEIKQSNANYRFVYLMGRNDDGDLFFYVDNEPDRKSVV